MIDELAVHGFHVYLRKHVTLFSESLCAHVLRVLPWKCTGTVLAVCFKLVGIRVRVDLELMQQKEKQNGLSKWCH